MTPRDWQDRMDRERDRAELAARRRRFRKMPPPASKEAGR